MRLLSPRLGAHARGFAEVGQALDQRIWYLRNVFVEIIMKCIIETKFVDDIKLILLILAACMLQYTIILRLSSPAAPESVDYGPMCFDPDEPVLLQREPTECHGCQFSSPNLHDGWSINPSTGLIEGKPAAGDIGSIHVYMKNKWGVVLNTTIDYSVAPRFVSQLKLTRADVSKFALSSLILLLFLPQWPCLPPIKCCF